MMMHTSGNSETSVTF